MKIVLSFILTILFASVVQYVGYWWLILPICFLINYIYLDNKWISFVISCSAIFTLWIIVSIMKNATSPVSISDTLSSLFGDIPIWFVYIFTGLVGAIPAGLAGFMGSWLKGINRKD